MVAPTLATKLYIPPLRHNLVSRPRLIQKLNEGLHQKLTLISAPAGFGKTTLLSEWIAENGGSTPSVRTAWLSLDEGDNDPVRFLMYFTAALQTVEANIGAGVMQAFLAPQPPPVEPILTALLNEIAALPEAFVLVLDDYHAIDSKPVLQALNFLVEHLPPQMHLVIATREDPPLPLARYRGKGQLTELRAADLRFTPSEAAGFLNQAMGLKLSAEDTAALEARTEGWIAGLQLAALALQGTLAGQGQPDTATFIQSFTGSHRFVMDYLVEEVMQQQPENIQTFLLQTSILERLCGPLCEAVVVDPGADEKGTKGQATLEYLERANLFIVPLDNERRWYRYHHLFGDLLRQRLSQSLATSKEGVEIRLNTLHIRASQWYEENGLNLEAFHHAAAANDVERAERLIGGKGIPLHLSGAVTPILDWLASLPKAVMDSKPSLWWRYGALLLINGQTIGVAEKLQSAEEALAALQIGDEPDDNTRHLMGRIATARATLGLTRYDVETMLTQSRRALKYLDPQNLFMRSNAHWTLGYAYLLLGDRTAARQALTEAVGLSQAAGAVFQTILATLGVGNVQEADNQLHEAAETYRRIIQLAGNQPQQIIHEAHLGLARILYEWNDLETAETHARQALDLARQYEQVIDRYILCEVFLARLKLAQGDVSGAAAVLAQADQSVRQYNFVHRAAEVAAAQVLTLIRQGNLAAAERLAHAHDLPLSRARVHLAQGNPEAALRVLEPRRQQVEAKGWQDERLRVMVLQAVAQRAAGEKDQALQTLERALELAEPGGFIRIFVDEGNPIERLIAEAAARGFLQEYTGKLRAAFEAEKQKAKEEAALPAVRALTDESPIEPLSQRELEVLRLIAQGLSNEEISEQLFLALSTVKGHNLRIFNKLQVQRRTEAVRRARELGLL